MRKKENRSILIQIEEAKITKNYDAATAIDALHACILEGRRREKARSSEGNLPSSYPDTWKPILDPHASVRAHTIPLMRAELERLNKGIAEVCLFEIPNPRLKPASLMIAFRVKRVMKL